MKRGNREFIGLLEACVEQIGCDYLSDLHSDRFSKHLIKAVKSIPAERYSSHEWVDAMNYIAGTRYTKSVSAQEAREILLTVLNRDQTTSVAWAELEREC